jgi:hypothetical protein
MSTLPDLGDVVFIIGIGVMAQDKTKIADEIYKFLWLTYLLPFSSKDATIKR